MVEQYIVRARSATKAYELDFCFTGAIS
jgi:hypothetical protein